ncbi:uncharacterized protein LOC131329708 [Rhododendron vialii]|uniref:uncharacterized protein LOC131329708 n=1 Tax=Rhododendron vialii TaxID=182163 RepID=UPI00265DFE46|nr:uncharacterized protein LOC131329708 [Rhododendron vialii]
MDDIWGDEGVSSGRVLQPDVGEEVRKTPRVEVLDMVAGGGLNVPLDSLEAIGVVSSEEEEMEEEEGEEGRSEDNNHDDDQEEEEEAEEGQVEFDQMEGGDGGESLVQNSSSLQDETNEGRLRSSRHWWREGNFMMARYPDGSVIVTLETKEKVTLQPSVLFAEAREEH